MPGSKITGNLSSRYRATGKIWHTSDIKKHLQITFQDYLLLTQQNMSTKGVSTIHEKLKSRLFPNF